METLYILRHGIAVAPGTPGIADDDRPLTPKGRKRLREIGRGLSRLDLNPDRIVISPLPRAGETAEIVAESMGKGGLVEVDDVLRSGSDPRAIRDWLRGRREARLMIVGHNPALSDLIALLVVGEGSSGPVCELKKGGIAALRLLPGGADRFELEWIATPRLIRRLSSVKPRPRG